MSHGATIQGTRFTSEEMLVASKAIIDRNTAILRKLLNEKGVGIESTSGGMLIKKLAVHCAQRLGRE